MKIIGCDFHTRYQQIAMLDDQTGELIERRLEHENGEAQQFYRELAQPVRVGVEATGPAGGRLIRALFRIEWSSASALHPTPTALDGNLGVAYSLPPLQRVR